METSRLWLLSELQHILTSNTVHHDGNICVSLVRCNKKKDKDNERERISGRKTQKEKERKRRRKHNKTE